MSALRRADRRVAVARWPPGERMTAGKAMALALGAAGSVVIRVRRFDRSLIVLAFASGVLFAFI